MMSNPDRRQHTRTPVRQSAVVVSNGGLSRIAAVVVDVSVSGAKLKVGESDVLETTFYMLLPEHQLQPCRLVWRKGQYAGVHYND